ncbi:Uncharacterized protein Adt_23278 [Abeliophyllum distichum]|uniref:Uncharacterized protein n=1 Tax=Abeliophyllum distichum TaxID=126358 RepID=A0ABD1SBJ0_9LAMI
MEVEWNEYMQPIGVNRSAFMSYLGTLARNGMRLPLTYAKWSNMDQHLVDYVWKEIEYNTNAPPGSRRNCLKSVADMWRDWKIRMKRKYYNGKTKEECLAIVPQEISVEQLKVLVEYWSTDRVEEISEKNKQNRMMLGPLHRTGRKSCANIRREMEEAGKPTDTLSVYIEMRTDLGGNPKDDYAAALIKVTSPELDSSYKERLRSEIVQDLSKEFEDKFNSMNSQIEFLKSQLLLSQEQEQTMGASTSHINATTADQVHHMSTDHEVSEH